MLALRSGTGGGLRGADAVRCLLCAEVVALIPSSDTEMRPVMQYLLVAKYGHTLPNNFYRPFPLIHERGVEIGYKNVPVGVHIQGVLGVYSGAWESRNILFF